MMKKQKTDRTEVDASLFRDTGAHYGSLSFPLLLSTMLHVIIFTVLFFAFFAPGHTPAERFPNSSVIDVSMITLPGSEPGSEFSEPADPQQEEFIPEPESPEPAGESEDEVSMPEPDEPKSEPEQPEVSVPEEPKAEMPEPKTPELTPEPKKLPEPVRKSEKKSEKSAKPVKHKSRDKRIANSKKLRPKTVADAIDRLKQKHSEKKKSGNGKKTVKEDNGNSGNGQGTGSTGENGAGRARTSVAIRHYRDNVIPNRINSNWALSEHLLNRRFGLRAVLVIKIMPDGFISDMWFEKTSGDSYFDDTVKKAVMKSNPLPPLPRDFPEPFYPLELVFTPSGLN